MKLTLVTGPMFAGKTSYLMNAVEHSKATNTILVTHKDDIRFSAGDELVNHDGTKLEHPMLRLETLGELHVTDALTNIKDRPVLLGIDEAQFFPDIVDFIRTLWKSKPS